MLCQLGEGQELLLPVLAEERESIEGCVLGR